MRVESIIPFMWGFVIGAVLLLIVIFQTGWVVTSSFSRANAEEMTKEAVLDSLSPICVAQFRQDADAAEKLKRLRGASFWDRGGLIEKWGFATMPGESKADRKVANKCAEELLG
ncbi:MAG: hypothetical protein ACE5JU_16120 [Candidatus Binatia bacterium]